MFDIGAPELLLIVVVAILVIGPKDMPMALRTAGRWIGKIRRMSSHFRSGIDTMIREAEMEEMEKKWQAQNRQIMEKYPDQEMTAKNASGEDIVPPPADDIPATPPAASAEARTAPSTPDTPPAAEGAGESSGDSAGKGAGMGEGKA